MYTMYVLKDARDEMYRYIGMTDDVYRRFKEHRACEGKNPGKDAWIQSLIVRFNLSRDALPLFAVYAGGSRNNFQETNEILDAFLAWGIVPVDYSDRQRRSWKKHPR